MGRRADGGMREPGLYTSVMGLGELHNIVHIVELKSVVMWPTYVISALHPASWRYNSYLETFSKRTAQGLLPDVFEVRPSWNVQAHGRLFKCAPGTHYR